MIVAKGDGKLPAPLGYSIEKVGEVDFGAPQKAQCVIDTSSEGRVNLDLLALQSEFQNALPQHIQLNV